MLHGLEKALLGKKNPKVLKTPILFRKWNANWAKVFLLNIFYL